MMEGVGVPKFIERQLVRSDRRLITWVISEEGFRQESSKKDLNQRLINEKHFYKYSENFE